ncbi:MAG: hypothetical protein LRY73_11000 [Bacillus sp. (in: Bacteria)]|nr:hypothetical protein [Bacillus sp. (in: firmicutes)]
MDTEREGIGGEKKEDTAIGSSEEAATSMDNAEDDQPSGDAVYGDNDYEEKKQGDSVDEYIASLFIKGNIHIGDSKEELLEKHGTPQSEGMYEGGEFFDYGTLTYFVNPESNKINAIARVGDELDLDDWRLAEKELASSLKMEGMNEMEGLWMEIYDWGSYDIMIERENAEADPYYIWLMEDGLFTE